MVGHKDLVNKWVFNLDLTVPSGERFEGTFEMHRPTIGERIRIGVLEAQKLGGLGNVDMVTAGLAHMLATLEVVVDKAPVWWKPEELRDLEVVQAVWQAYVDRLQEFQTKT